MKDKNFSINATFFNFESGTCIGNPPINLTNQMKKTSTEIKILTNSRWSIPTYNLTNQIKLISLTNQEISNQWKI